MTMNRKVSVIGLGYVGLPVAVAFGHKHPVIGFDVNPQRILELQEHNDKTHEVSHFQLKASKVEFTHRAEDLKKADFHIIAVPTPIDNARQPNLSYLESASKIVGEQLQRGDIVVYESTVYPGATEEDCVPILEKYSGLISGKDFNVGYSPERINPADKEHSFENIVKVVSGDTPQTCDVIAKVYGDVISVGVYKAQSIRVAEAAKVIENTQRDLNIALMNELALIFERMGIDTQAVLKAAQTKWNFLPFKPGLVGGHCIGVDPYYLTYKSKQLGYRPEVILAGRRINDGMGKYIAEQTIKRMIHFGCHVKGSKIAILGLTFKENCPDLRNSRVIDVIQELKSYEVDLLVHDPIACKDEANKEYGIPLCDWEEIADVNAMVLCVAHQTYLEIPPEVFAKKFAGTRIITDVKAVLHETGFEEEGIELWRL